MQTSRIVYPRSAWHAHRQPIRVGKVRAFASEGYWFGETTCSWPGARRNGPSIPVCGMSSVDTARVMRLRLTPSFEKGGRDRCDAAYFRGITVLAEPQPVEHGEARYHIVLVTASGGGEPRLRGSEHSELRWVSIDRALAIPLAGESGGVWRYSLEEFRGVLLAVSLWSRIVP